MTSPVTITAITGDTCSAWPSTNAAYGVTSAITVSSTGSVTRRRTRMTPAASTPPTAAPPAARTTNWPAPCSSTPPAVVRPAGDDQQGRRRNAQPAGEGRDHRAQYDQEQDGLYTAHTADLALAIGE